MRRWIAVLPLAGFAALVLDSLMRARRWRRAAEAAEGEGASGP